MDFSNGKEPWNCQDEDYVLEKDSALDISPRMWDYATQEEDIAYLFEENTPIKACSSILKNLNPCGERNKPSQECRETSSQAKRRRMLHFRNEHSDIAIQSDDSFILKSKERIDAIDDDALLWDTELQEEASSSGLECLDESEGWLLDCLNDMEMQINSDDMNPSKLSGAQTDITEFSNSQLVPGIPPAQPQNVRTSRSIIFKGRKSYMTTPTKLASSVAYPFTLIKPSGANGDVTLKEINQRIKNPTPSKAEDVVNFGTSAFSGKPVVNKTKIRTDGGKGSITIMRTRG